MNKFLLLILVGFSFCFPSTKECQDDPDFYMALAGTLGKGNWEEPSLIYLPCDTMIIHPGVVLTISKNTFVSFQDPRPNNLIIVKGTLLIYGESDSRVRISNSTDTAFFDKSAMNKPWKGIYVTEIGSIFMKNTEVFGAETPIQSLSTDVRIGNSFFYNGNKLILPNNKEYHIPSNKYIMELDFKIPNSPATYSSFDNQSPSHDTTHSTKPKKRSILKSPWFWGSVGAAVLVGGGCLTWYIYPESSEKSKNVKEVDPGLN